MSVKARIAAGAATFGLVAPQFAHTYGKYEAYEIQYES
jgi:hypothetical protein